MQTQQERIAGIRRYGRDVAYVEYANARWEIWTYSDGQRVYLEPRYTLEGLQAWAKFNGFGLVYVN